MFSIWPLLNMLEVAPMGLPHNGECTYVSLERLQHADSNAQSCTQHRRELKVIIRKESDGLERAGEYLVVR